MERFFRLSGSKIFTAALLIVLILLGSVVWYATERLREEALRSNLHVTALHAKSFERYFSQHLDGLKLLMENLSANLHPNALEQHQPVQRQLLNALVSAPYLRSFSLMDSKGVILLSSEQKNSGQTVDLSGFYPEPFAGARILQFGGVWAGRDIYEGVPLGTETTGKALPGNSFLPVILKFEVDEKPYILLTLLNPLYFTNHYLQNSEGILHVIVQDLSGRIMMDTQESTNVGGMFLSGQLNEYLQGPLSDELILEDQGGQKIVAYKSSRTFPFVTVVSADYEEALSEWTQERDDILMVTATVAALLMSVSVWMFIKSQQQRLRLLEEERLEAQRRKGVIETIPSAVVLLDASGRILMHNGQWGRFISTYHPQPFLENRLEPIMNSIFEGQEDKEFLVEELHEVLIGNKTSFSSEYALSLESEERHYSLHINTIHEPSLVGSVLIQMDVTEKALAQKQLHETLQSLHAQVEEAVQKTIEQDHVIFEQRRHHAMSTLIVNIAHQWRQPLQVMATAMDTVEMENESINSEKISSALDLIDREIRYLSDVIRFFTEIYNEEVPGRKDVIKVKENLTRLFRLLRFRFEEKEIQVSVDVADFVQIHCTEKDFSEMSLEIIENAISVMEARSLESLEISIRTEQKAGEIALLFTDNGGGFDEKLLPQIFDPYVTSFFKSRNKGLGLYQVKMTMEKRYNGQVYAGNIENGGYVKLVFPDKI